MEQTSIYEQIRQRTDGNVYLCVVGPVRTGKSTFIKRFMEELVLPNIDNVYRRERARDELPPSGSGKTIMTSEPKFVPEDAVEISPDGTAKLSVRLIDSVGYMVAGAIGAEEDGQPRMVTTPWYDHEIPMPEAAELGTKKVMEDHGTIGIVMTTDGTVTDIPRADYEEAEDRAIRDMQATGKPFLVIVNSQEPDGEAARELQAHIAETYGVTCLTANCLTMEEPQITALLQALLRQFPVTEMRFFLPSWMRCTMPCAAAPAGSRPCARRSRPSSASASWSRWRTTTSAPSTWAPASSAVRWTSPRGCSTRSSATRAASPSPTTASC